jgi:Tfp pilus assembly protein PilO
MDRFEALGRPQKILVAFVLMALVGGGFYFLLITDAEAEIMAAQSRAGKAEAKLAQLKKYESGELMKALKKEEEKLHEELKANMELLPENEEIPQLISSIKRQADELDLKIILFKKGERYPEDYVDVIPLEMQVEGAFPVVISFFEAIAEPGMRMMTLSDIKFVGLSLNEVLDIEEAAIAETKITQGIIQGADRGGSAKKNKDSAVERFLKKIDSYEAAAKKMRVAATFTINAYSYSGELVSAAVAKKRQSTKKKRRR